ncbi:MAG: hypothetical protein RLZZ566_1010 [Pseudomonadota bacterium]|jgi:hypothetical protein
MPWAQYGEKVQLHWQAQPEQLHLALNRSLPRGLEPSISSKPIDFENEAVKATVQKAESFVSQQDLPSDTAYEFFIFKHKRIPTRNNAHDFFNGLCWLRFPKSKAQLNRLQAQAIATQGVGAHRGALRDALTLFDENAGLLCAPAPLWQALKNKQWHELFVTNRDAWQQVRLVLFGHALLEKLLQPYKGITAHVLCLPMPLLISDEEVDVWLCQQLTPAFLQTKPFVPLPLAGVPGFWPDNETPAFFEDKKVFRD